MIRVIGIDPGSVITGYGIVDSDGQRSILVSHGHIRVEGDDLAARLGCVFERVGAVLREWQPQEMAIEDVFMSRNAASALKLGQARGAAVVAACQHRIPVSEYTPRRVKQAVVGNGGADKKQVQHMIGILLSTQERLQADAADALAIALCHVHSRGRDPGVAQLLQRRRR